MYNLYEKPTIEIFLCTSTTRTFIQNVVRLDGDYSRMYHSS